MNAYLVGTASYIFYFPCFREFPSNGVIFRCLYGLFGLPFVGGRKIGKIGTNRTFRHALSAKVIQAIFQARLRGMGLAQRRRKQLVNMTIEPKLIELTADDLYSVYSKPQVRCHPNGRRNVSIVQPWSSTKKGAPLESGRAANAVECNKTLALPSREKLCFGMHFTRIRSLRR